MGRSTWPEVLRGRCSVVAGGVYGGLRKRSEEQIPLKGIHGALQEL